MKCTNCNKLLTKLRHITAEVGLHALYQLEKGITVDQKTTDTLQYIVEQTDTKDLDEER